MLLSECLAHAVYYIAACIPPAVVVIVKTSVRNALRSAVTTQFARSAFFRQKLNNCFRAALTQSYNGSSAAVKKLTVTPGKGRLTLKWTNNAHADGYLIYCADSKGKYRKVAEASSNQLTLFVESG